MNNFKDILRYIPGFRTGVKWKQITAIVYYILALLMLISGIGYFLFFISMPFIIFSVVDLFKKKDKISKISLVVALIIFFVGTATIPKATTPTSSKNLASTESKSSSDDTIKPTASPTDTATPKVEETPTPSIAPTETVNPAPNESIEATPAPTIAPITETANSDDGNVTVYYVPNSKVYHLSKTDSTLKKSKNILSMSLKEAKTKGMHQSESKAD